MATEYENILSQRSKKLNVKVTDEEISAYEAKYPKLFKAEGLVKLSYTYFF